MRVAVSVLATVALLCSLGTARAAESPSPRRDSLFAIGLRGEALSHQLLSTLDDVLAVAVESLGPYKVMTQKDVDAQLGQERLKDLAGCTEVSCAADLAGALGTRFILWGTVARLGGKLLVSLTILDTTTHESVGRAKVEVEDDEARYSTAIDLAVRRLLKLPEPTPPEAAAPARAEPADARPPPAPVYVLDPSGHGVPGSVLSTVEAAVAQAAQEEGLRAISRSESQSILEKAADLNKLGSDDSTVALAALGKALSARYLVATTVTTEGEDTVLLLRLVDSTEGSVVSRRQLRTSDLGKSLVETAKAATRLLLAPLFASLKGQVQLDVTEEGANVLVDGEQVGVTPVKPLVITGGHHLLGVNKEGFLRFQESVRIGGGDVVRRMVELRPSKEFLTNYRARNGLYRKLAWVSTLVAVPLLGGAVGGALLKVKQDDKTAAIHDEYLALSPLAQLARESEFKSRQQSSVNSANTYGFWSTSLGVGTAVVGLVSAYFWLFGDNPDRYERFER